MRDTHFIAAQRRNVVSRATACGARTLSTASKRLLWEPLFASAGGYGRSSQTVVDTPIADTV